MGNGQALGNLTCQSRQPPKRKGGGGFLGFVGQPNLRFSKTYAVLAADGLGWRSCSILIHS